MMGKGSVGSKVSHELHTNVLRARGKKSKSSGVYTGNASGTAAFHVERGRRRQSGIAAPGVPAAIREVLPCFVSRRAERGSAACSMFQLFFKDIGKPS
ncbi:hypothetical protein ALCH109712_06465 [Alkalicoccus chagannorensis]